MDRRASPLAALGRALPRATRVAREELFWLWPRHHVPEHFRRRAFGQSHGPRSIPAAEGQPCLHDDLPGEIAYDGGRTRSTIALGARMPVGGPAGARKRTWGPDVLALGVELLRTSRGHIPPVTAGRERPVTWPWSPNAITRAMYAREGITAVRVPDDATWDKLPEIPEI